MKEKCPICKYAFYEEKYGDHTRQECSEFCNSTTAKEKDDFVNLKEGDEGVFPCSMCGVPLEGTYTVESHCSGCSSLAKQRETNERFAALEKELAEAKSEVELWKKEAKDASEYTRTVNRWWKFKLERVQIEMRHYEPKKSLPWKKFAKIFFARIRIREAGYEHEIKQLLDAIREHRDQKGHDRCWLDDEKLYSYLPDNIEYNPKLPARPEFLKNCERFYDSRQGDCPKLHEWGDSEIEKKRQWAARWKRLAKQRRPTEERLWKRIEELTNTLNHPVTSNFVKAVEVEAAHQRERWKDSDKLKTNADWFWLIGYLAGKALWNPDAEYEEKEKRLHRIVTVAAAACNWWIATEQSV